MSTNSRNAILFALGMAIVLCAGCSTVRLVGGGNSIALSPQKSVGTPPPKAHSHREIRLQFTKEF